MEVRVWLAGVVDQGPAGEEALDRADRADRAEIKSCGVGGHGVYVPRDPGERFALRGRSKNKVGLVGGNEEKTSMNT